MSTDNKNEVNLLIGANFFRALEPIGVISSQNRASMCLRHY